MELTAAERGKYSVKIVRERGDICVDYSLEQDDAGFFLKPRVGLVAKILDELGLANYDKKCMVLPVLESANRSTSTYIMPDVEIVSLLVEFTDDSGERNSKAVIISTFNKRKAKELYRRFQDFARSEEDLQAVFEDDNFLDQIDRQEPVVNYN